MSKVQVPLDVGGAAFGSDGGGGVGRAVRDAGWWCRWCSAACRVGVGYNGERAEGGTGRAIEDAVTILQLPK